MRHAIALLPLVACATDPDASEPLDVAAAYVQTPVGLVHGSCVHELALGDEPNDPPCGYPVMQTGADRDDVAERTQAPVADGWIENGYAQLPRPVGDFWGNFHVPAEPAHVGNQIIFFFPALEDSNWGNIMQPVLSWGREYSSASGWQIASWYGGSAWGGNYYHSAPQAVNVGDTLFGDMQVHAGNNWLITTRDATTGASTSVSVLNTLAWTNAFAALEVYGVGDCAMYPATYNNMWNLTIYDRNSQNMTPGGWTQQENRSGCGEAVTWSAPYVNLFYDGGELPVGATLWAGQTLRSPDGRFRFTMQTDGNLVLYQGSTAIWASNTYHSGGTRAVMQTDGNLVVYTASNRAVWASNTYGRPGASLWIQNDGNAVIYRGGPIWASNTCCR